ncbi:MAG: DUF3800 domain-containing protein [Firmicutes bacterium]|nr:DUF3800 domain-containing protein [Bacillota bacterium]
MGELSIFIDESGDMGDYRPHSPYYIITMVFHDQSNDISEHIRTLDSELRDLKIGDMAIHTEPLIRREEAYSNLWPNQRRALLTKLYFFAVKAPIQYKSFVFEKKQFDNVFEMEARMAREIAMFLRDNMAFFQKYSKVILYYDNGQSIINRLINTVFATELTRYEVRKVLPVDYRLFQVADLICTLTLTEKKAEHVGFSKSELYIFKSKRAFYKDFINRLRHKQLP